MRPGSILKGAAPDGSDIGADFPALSARVAGVVAGIMNDPASQTTMPLAPRAAFTPNCVDLACTFADNSTDADGTVTAWAWSFGTSSSTVPSPSAVFPAPGSYTVTLTVTDDDGAQSAIAMPVQVTVVLHAAYSGLTTKWSSPSGNTNYWSADVTVAIHGADERLIPGATVTAAWTGRRGENGDLRHQGRTERAC